MRKSTQNLFIVFFLVQKNWKRTNGFFSQLHEHLGTPGDVELNPLISVGLSFLFIEHKWNDMLNNCFSAFYLQSGSVLKMGYLCQL